MGRRVVDVEVVLLDVFAVIAFAVRESEEPLLEDRVAAIPQRDPHAQVLVAIAEAGERIFVPTVGAAARVVVREVVPRAAVGAVVLAHRAPGAVAHVSAPALPVRGARRRGGKAQMLDCR
jgi:hypothetical protein